MTGRRGVWVGRARELSALDEILDQARAGQGGCALVAGDVGIGKTRLLEELAERARARGFVTAWGRGWELGGAPSFWPWLQILRTLLERPLSPSAVAQRLRALLPEPGPGVTAPAADAFQLYDTVHSYLQAHARLEPLALFIDDLHALDDSSIVLAEFVARGIGRGHVALFGSQRTGADPSPELERRTSRLYRAVQRIALHPLGLEDVRAWMQQATGATDIDVARRIHEASDGNPLFVSELLRLSELSPQSEASPLPPTLRALLRERLAVLDREQLPALRAAALIGRQFTLPLLADVAEVELGALGHAVHAASRAGVLGHIAPGHYRFSHALVAETLAYELSPAERHRLHRRAATALERRHRSDPAKVNDIARHWLEAGVDAAPLAVAAAERAALEAMRRFAFADAAALYGRALDALALFAALDNPRAADLYVAQVEALSRAGRREQAEAICARAVELARIRDDGPLLARAALALGSENYLGNADLRVARLLERALAALPLGDGELRARVSARLASARQPALNPEAPMALAREAIAMARRLELPTLSLQVTHAALGALMDFAPAEERAALNAEALELATRLRDYPRALQAAQRLAFDRIELADLDGFAHALGRYEALAAEVEQPRYAWVPAMFRAMQADWLGDRARAEHWEERARALRDQGNAEGAALVPARGLARALLHADGALLERFVDGLTARAPDSSGSLWLSALRDVWCGRHDTARQALDRLAARGLTRFVGRADASDESARDSARVVLTRPEAEHAVGLGYLHMLEVAVEIACCLRDAAWADKLYSELVSSSGKPFLLTTLGFSLHGSVDHALMRLCVVGRRWDAARDHAALAIELCTRLGARALLDRIELDIARIVRGEREPPSGIEPAVPEASPSREAASATPDELQLTLEGEYWTLSARDALCRVQDGRGMRMLARLVEQPGREIHVLELSGSPRGLDHSDAGEVLDARARAEYQRRLSDLQSEMNEASRFNDLGRQQRLAEETEALMRELSRGFGLDGRARRSGSSVERARVNVRRRIALALRRIRAASPKLGAKLESRVRTGIFCVYLPVSRAPS